MISDSLGHHRSIKEGDRMNGYTNKRSIHAFYGAALLSSPFHTNLSSLSYCGPHSRTPRSESPETLND